MVDLLVLVRHGKAEPKGPEGDLARELTPDGVAALEEAIAVWGAPSIFNTDQGSQFTATAFVEVLKSHEIEISMDGVNRCLDNIYVERLWRSVKYEEIYLKCPILLLVITF